MTHNTPSGDELQAAHAANYREKARKLRHESDNGMPTSEWRTAAYLKAREATLKAAREWDEAADRIDPERRAA